MAELRLSEDGLHYWDGRQWVTTLSPDGRFRWNGSAWVPNASTALGAYASQEPGRMVRAPTPWTKPMQNTVTALNALTIVYLLVLAFLLSTEMSQIFNQVLQQSAAQNPNASPPPAQMVNGVTSFFSFVFWGGAMMGIAFCVLIIVGALKRWTWMFYVVLVFGGLTTILLPFNLIAAIGRSTTPGVPSVAAWESWLQVLYGTASAVLFVWMVIALVRYGPWATMKEYHWPVVLPATGS
jgi:hypothetical protein